MSKKENQNQISFGLKGIEILNISFNSPAIPLTGIQKYNYNINIEHKINVKKKLVFVIVSVETVLQEKNEKLADIKVSCIYDLGNFDKYLNKDKNKVFLPDEYNSMLNSISLSTTRGIMFSQFRGTFLHNAHLPIIDPKAFSMKEQIL